VKVTLDSYELKASSANKPAEHRDGASGATAIEILLDGVEARTASRPRGG
jgi:hypothetical protein